MTRPKSTYGDEPQKCRFHASKSALKGDRPLFRCLRHLGVGRQPRSRRSLTLRSGRPNARPSIRRQSGAMAAIIVDADNLAAHVMARFGPGQAPRRVYLRARAGFSISTHRHGRSRHHQWLAPGSRERPPRRGPNCAGWLIPPRTASNRNSIYWDLRDRRSGLSKP
jgi:hypothetical protein